MASFFDVVATAHLQHLELVKELLGVGVLVLSQWARAMAQRNSKTNAIWGLPVDKPMK